MRVRAFPAPYVTAALALMVVVPALLATPAWAATPAAVVVQAPAPGAVVTGVVAVTVRAQPADPGELLERVTIGIRQTDQPPAGLAPFEASYTASWPSYRSEAATVRLAWDTGAAAAQAGSRAQPSAAGTVNGRFRVTAEQVTVPTALGLPLPGRNEYAAPPVDVMVNNPPAAPANVTARLEGAGPVVRWTAGAEPDLLGWQVLRSAGGPAVRVGTVRAGSPPAFADPGAPAGVPLAYRVLAVRRSPLTG
ncbi:MAG: hypothetical protein ACRDJO_02745, partial [Actinomycetota bacterium]